MLFHMITIMLQISSLQSTGLLFGATLVSILNNENAEVYNDTQSTSYI